MQLTLLFDHRFCRDKNGLIFSRTHYNYPLLARRYLQVFDEMRIVARVQDVDEERTEEVTEGEGVEIVSLGNWNGPWRFFQKRKSVLSTIVENVSAAEAVIMIAPGIVGALALHELLAQGHPYGVEVVGDPHDVFAAGAIHHPLRLFFRWWFPRRLRRQCAEACAAAYVSEQSLQRRYPPAPRAFSTHYSSIELPESAIVDAPRNGQTKEPISIVSVGSLAQLYKAPDVLIDAVALCTRQGLANKLVWMGDGKHKAEMEARAAQLGLASSVRLLGQVPAGRPVRAQLDQADLFVLPSRTEGLPRAMIEAMARALPCLGSTAGGIPELLPPEDLVRPGDASALARKIKEVVTNPERMAQMSARNLQKAKEYRADILRERRSAFYRYVRARTEEWLASQRCRGC